MARMQIDRGKLRVEIRKMGYEYAFYMLDEAIELLPDTKLLKMAKKFINPARFQPDGTEKADLRAEVKAFEKASLSGEYYQDFDVNWKNSNDVSLGTAAWNSTCCRLLQRCVAQARKDSSAELLEAFDTLFGLLDRIDENPDDIIFFADEGGSWQVGVDWAKVLPAWIRCLSAHAEPEEYARRVVEVVEKHQKFRVDEYLKAARRVGTAEQREAVGRLGMRQKGAREKG